MNNNLINVDQLDFDGIKANIIQYLKGQTVFADYEYEGSALSTLIDLLAYNTHYNALYTNFALNESFLDSASKYSSVVSLAKSIGYTSKSIRASRAEIRVVVSGLTTDPNPQTITMPRGTIFSSKVGNETYQFVTEQAYTAGLSNGEYVFESVKIQEGRYVKNEYVASALTQFIIPSFNADMTTLGVKVYESANTSEYQIYDAVDNLLTIKGIDKVFFVKQREDLYYEVYFGNDVIGKAISPGNVVQLDYLVTSGDKANGANLFAYSGGFISNALYDIQLISVSSSGAPAESIDEIKFNAPRAYLSQNRAVTTDDYKNQLLSNFPQLESVTVWGGQDNEPKQFGKVFISAKPFGRSSLTELEKSDIRNFLKLKRAILTVQHEFVEPKIIEILVQTSVYFSEKDTIRTIGDIESLVRGQIESYATTLNKFNQTFRYSKLIKLIDNSEKSIVSNITNISLRYKQQPYFGVTETYKLDLRNPIKKQAGSFYTSKFNTDISSDPCFISDDGNGILKLYQTSSDNIKTELRSVGTINYTNGYIQIDSLNIISLYSETGDFYYFITPLSNDIIPVNQYVLTIPSNNVSVTVLPDSVSQGFLQAGLNHQFSASR